ncbi:hypothetical protein DPMN_056559 [Dreissena polymorpha]|uniref:RING-type domain-containing protein n=1 Tax=Dreissena polymorpha TaxID=45954 RepID=A0A9D4HTA4_DREPO|nr:hypothetical protein DPMN_056559 [Dreissena polymorpha]
MRHAPDGFTFDSSCVICLEDFEQLEIVRGLPCKHTFRDACVINWLLSETSNRLCPSCRFPAHDYSGINANLQLDIDDFCQMFD